MTWVEVRYWFELHLLRRFFADLASLYMLLPNQILPLLLEV
jgi:hypothetical protein